MKLSNESKTLFIPLYGKALMSKNKLFIKDIKSEEIINNLDFNFKKLKQSKWLSMYMAVRSSIIDEICNKYLLQKSDVIVIHLGCGLDSRCLRVNNNYKKWYDIDFQNVIELRKNFYIENEKYKMIGSSVTNLKWINKIDLVSKNVLIVAEGLTMYLSEKEIQELLIEINKKFNNVNLVFDAYSKKAVKFSKYKNPVNKMNANIKWGMDDSKDLIKLNSNLKFIKEYEIKKKESSLKGLSKYIFEKIYCGKISKSLYKIYEFELEKII